MLVGDNFTENFTADFAVGVFRNVRSSLSSQIYQLLLKVISLHEKRLGCHIF